MGYDPDTLNDEAEDPAEISFGGTIVGINEKTAEEIFGEDAQGSPDDEYIEVTVETEAGDDVTDVFSLPKSPQSWYNPMFKLGRFKKKYESVPQTGMDVEMTVDKNGFLAIELAPVE